MPFIDLTKRRPPFNTDVLRCLLPVLIVWAVLVAWRPLVLGFYHDDWASVAMPIGGAGGLMDLLGRDPARPLYILVLYPLRIAFGDNYVAWQGALALLHLVCAFAIFFASRSILWTFSPSVGAAAQWPATLAALVWLIFPWSLGYSGWSVMLPPTLGVLMGIVSLIIATRPEATFRDAILSLTILAASWLIYEATWLWWLPIGLLLILRNLVDRKSILFGARYLGLAFFLQGAATLLNRLLSAQSPLGKKASASIVPMLQVDLSLAKSELLPLLGEGVWFVAGGLLLLVAVAALNLQRPKPLLKGLIVSTILLSGALLAVCLYAAAGYAIQWTGLFSRSTLPISFWLSLLLSYIFSLAWINAARPLKILAICAIAAICLPLMVSLAEQSLLWKKSWSEQQDILHAIPDSVVALADRQSIILMDVPKGTEPVFTFSAFWDISGAIIRRVTGNITGDKLYPYATALRAGEFRTTWDGKVVKQFWCTAPTQALWELNAEKAYLWTYPAPSAETLTAPFEFGCIKR